MMRIMWITGDLGNEKLSINVKDLFQSELAGDSILNNILEPTAIYAMYIVIMQNCCR